jgi:uncharacterized protein YbjT (DUF2867 family)
MRLLVVGATGSLGRLTVTEAAQRGHDVAALVRDPARANLPEPAVKVRGDVLDPESLDPVCCAPVTRGASGRSPARVLPAS